MSTLRFWIPALLAAATSLLLAQEKSAASATDVASKKIPAGPTIGVVDLAKAFERYPKAIKMGEELKKLGDDCVTRLDEIKKKINETREWLKTLSEGSREFKQKQFELDSLMQVHKFQAGQFDEMLGIAEMKMQLAVYEDLELAVAKVAKNRGVHLVVRTYDAGPAPTFSDTATPKELRQMQQRVTMFDRRQVWFADDSIDLTGDLIKLLEVPLEKDALPAAPKSEAPKAPAKPERGGG